MRLREAADVAAADTVGAVVVMAAEKLFMSTPIHAGMEPMCGHTTDHHLGIAVQADIHDIPEGIQVVIPVIPAGTQVVLQAIPVVSQP